MAQWICPARRVEYTTSDALATLLELLLRLEAHTELVPVRHKDDLRLGMDGRVISNGLRYSWLAFNQISTRLSPGLRPLLRSLGGAWDTDSLTAHGVDRRLAADVFNRIVDVRFSAIPAISEQQQVQNRCDNLIEGFVGLKYRYLPNATLMEAVQQTLSTIAPETQLHQAVMQGRRLALVFVDPTKEIYVQSEPFYCGYYFANSEAGECSVRASSGLMHATIPLWILSRTCHAPHAGKDFFRRVYRLCHNVALSDEQWTKLQHAVVEFAQRPLGVTTSDGRLVEERVKRLAREMAGCGLPTKIAKRYLHRSLLGDDAAVDSTAMSPRFAAADCTWGDVMLCCLRSRRAGHVRHQEAMGSVLGKLVPRILQGI